MIIKVHDLEGNVILINGDNILYVLKHKQGSFVVLTSEELFCKEKPDEIYDIIFSHKGNLDESIIEGLKKECANFGGIK